MCCYSQLAQCFAMLIMQSITIADRVNATGKGHKSRDIGNKASKNFFVKLRWIVQNHNAEQAV